MSQHIPGTHHLVRILAGRDHERTIAAVRPRAVTGRRVDLDAPIAVEVNRAPASPSTAKLEPLEPTDRTTDPLRPDTLEGMIGQTRLKPLLRRIIDEAKRSRQPLDHVLLIGASGTGKSTLAHVIACELGARVFMLKPPVSLDMFERLRASMRDGDVLYLDEIHLQVSGDRRGVGQAPDPETFYHVMEDRKLVTLNGPVSFPAITIIGATTDSGLLPEPFLARFAVRPYLDPYTIEDMAEMARRTARKLRLTLDPEAAWIFARASRSNPRQLNAYLKNARMLARGGAVTTAVAEEVVIGLNSTTLDGLTVGMQGMLRFLLRSPRVVRGETIHQASVNSIATALGHSRDTKAVSLYIEPYLIERGYVEIAHSGRRLTPAGVDRALNL